MSATQSPDTSKPTWSLVLMARYNRQANRRLYAACAGLSDAERRAERGAFFGSIHATLNHIMVGDRIWLGRLRDGEAPPANLTDILFDDFDDLRSAREALDAEIEAFAEGLTADDVAGPFTYRNTAGEPRSDPFCVCATQMFNHQTHHRGQLHCMLTQAGVADPPVFDVHYVVANPVGSG